MDCYNILVFKRNLDYFLCSVKDVPYESFSDNRQANKKSSLKHSDSDC